MLLRYLRTPSVYYCPETFRMLHEPPVNRSPGREWLDGVDVLRRAYLRALKRVDKENLKRANLVLTNSCYTREAIYRVYGIFARVNLPGVDGEVFRPRGSEKGDYVLSVGALTPLKAHDFVVESVALIPTSLRPKVMIVGNYEEAGEREYLTRLAEEKGVELTIAVNVTDEELVELYNRARLTAYAPIMEPFGLVALESMACGTPVVGVREGGVRETVIDGETGILTGRDTSEFANAIRSLLEDEGLARRYGRQGRELILERWTWERSVEEIERHLKSSSSS
jgi:glycosyltransferase involved in cell wall biosynthesis